MNKALEALKAADPKKRVALAAENIRKACAAKVKAADKLKAAAGTAWDVVVIAHLAGVPFVTLEAEHPDLPKLEAYRSGKSGILAAIGAAIPLINDKGEILSKPAAYLAVQCKELGVSLTDKAGDKKTQKVLGEEIKAAKAAKGSLDAANQDTGNVGESVKLTPQQTIALGLQLLAQADDALLVSFKKEIGGIVGRLDAIAKAKRAAMKKAA